MRNFFSGPVLLLGIALGLTGMSTTWATDPTSVVAPTLPLTPQANAAAIVKAQNDARLAEARKNVPGLVNALNDEADGQLRAHNFAAAEKLRLQVLKLEEDFAGRESLPVADALLNLGWFYNNLARYEQAQAALDRCQEIRLRLLGEETAPVAEVLNALGALEDNRGNLDLAQAFYEQAVAIQEKVLGKASPVTATTWNNLATLDWITGDYATAQKLFNEALAVREKTVGPESLAVAATLNNLALLDVSLGDYDEARAYYQRALRIRTTRLGPDHPATLTTLSQLGQLDVQQGNDADAEPLLVQAMQQQEKIYEADSPDLARTLMQLALLYDREKKYDLAGPLLTQALEIRRRALGPEHHEYADSLAALARHDHAQGRLGEALPLYEQALRIVEDALGEDHPDTLEIATDLTYLNLELGKRDDAAALAGKVIEAQQKELNSVFAFAPERQRFGFEQTLQPCELPAALDDADLVAEAVLRTKGVVLDSLLEDEAIVRAARDPEVQELMQKRRLLAAQLTQAQGEPSGPDYTGWPEATVDREPLEKEEQDLEASLARKGIGSGETRRALSTDVGAVKDALPDDAALVEFVAYRRYVGRLNAQPAYGVLVLTRNAPAKWLPLVATTEIDAQVRLYQKYVRKRVHDATLAGVLHGLYAELCAPVLTALPEGIHRLIISPDSNLNFVSFATLLDPKEQFFGEDFALDYVSSGRDLLEHPQAVPASGATNRSMVVFADPDYDHLPDAAPGKTRPKSGADEDDLLEPLPGTEREAAFLQQEGKAQGIGVTVFRGAEASKANLAQQDSPYVLHLATHGLYLSPDDWPNLPVPADPDGVGLLAGQPMSRSVLALAGAELTLRAWQKGTFPPTDNDGVLTAQQVAALHLDQTWLVVLSACDTGGGEAAAGEGVLGLRRGFAEAGTQNLLLTLWPVEDSGTADLMEAFYGEALQSGDAPGALAQVQRASLVSARQKESLWEAVRKAGPFILSY